MREYTGKNYRGSDLPTSFKQMANAEKRRLKKIFEGRGCTDFVMNYGFWYFSGFFTAPNGQIWYFHSGDVRGGYRRLLLRTATSYQDYTGGVNQYCAKDTNSLKNFRL